MLNLKPLFFAILCSLSAAAPPAPANPGPPLEPGEALALAGPDGVVRLFGPASVASPMGSLAQLVWIKLEGAEWAANNVQFKCTGRWEGLTCKVAKGHGRVDLARALIEGCDLAFVAWARTSAAGWQQDYGDGPGRARLEDAFGPFLGRRMPAGEAVPLLDAPWVGAGELLQVSPAAMLEWLLDPAQDAVLRRSRRLLLSFFKETFGTGTWWIQAGTAEVPKAPGVTSAWAAGNNGSITAVLRLPAGKGKADALARFRAILRVPAGQ